MASAMISPTLSIRVGRDVPTWAIALFVFARLGQLLQRFNDGDSGLVDTALQVHRVHSGSN
jgi:hypothetical protein